MTVSEPNDPRLNWSTLSQTERDAAYDNNKAVANSPALIAARNATSARVRALHPGTLDIAYGTGEKTKFDLYPAHDRSAPCLVFLHGGYWQRNSREDFAMMIEGVAAHGWSVAIPGYSLAPKATLTEIVQEIWLALDWLAANRVSQGIAGPIVLSGWSAGAQLTALALHHPVVTAGLAISGVYDLAPIRDTGLNAALRLTDDEIAMLSPLRLPIVHKPLAIAYGSAELPALVWDSRKFYEARKGAAAPGQLVVVAGANHFTVLEQLRRADGTLTKVALSLVG
ncbi:MAG TPA: alpha/beta hydrolase [Bradyrhizobium sp.]|nr:alpha/beta hydrolase [Bradyrhizobium sp.]